MKEKKNVDSILDELYNHLNDINLLCWDYKWSTEPDLEEYTGKYSCEKYGYGKNLTDFINDIEQALVNLEKYK